MKLKDDVSVKKLLHEEEKFGLSKMATYNEFSKKINQIKQNFKSNFQKLKQKNKKIIGYGAPAKATTKLNYFGVDKKDIDFIVEDNKLKINKYIPLTKIKIDSSDKIFNKDIDKIIVMAWNFYDEIKSKYPQIKDKFISITDLEQNEFKN